MERPPESLKSFANRIASLAQSEGSAKMIRLLLFAGFMSAGSPEGRGALAQLAAPPDPLPPPVGNPNHLGIWERKEEAGRVCFVRRLEMMHEWALWANLGRIEAKGAQKRVVLIGESVARGYLYDPEFTPAIALDAMLKARLGAEEVEVIDLARVNLSYEIRELAIGALELEPDVVIILAGNNWGLKFPQPSEVVEINEAVTKDGIAGAKRASEAHIARNARRVVNDVASTYERAGVPLIWMIPEFNLADWRDPITNAPHLPGNLNRQWLSLLDEAETALGDGDDERASQIASRMVELDGGVSVAGLYIMAECHERAGRIDAARDCLERARDAVCWDLSRQVMPRTYRVTQNAVREALGKYPVQLIDLPALFKEHLGGGIPGRNLIIDYCHLTTEGIQVAMGAAAACVVKALTGTEPTWREMSSKQIAPSKEIEAEASFLAAVHNAHWFQSYDLIRYYCSRALELSPHVADLMVNYLELQTRPFVPALMSGSEEHISKMGSTLMRQYLLSKNEKRLEKVLYDATVDALEEAGVDVRARLERFRRDEHSVAHGATNLLEYYYCSAVNQPQELAWLIQTSHHKYQPNKTAYYKAYWPESRFVFFADEGEAVRLTLTCRLPVGGSADTPVSLVFNGRLQAQLEVDREWGTWEIDLAGHTVRDGLNEVSVWWPMPEFPGLPALEKVRANLFERELAEFYPIFGEIHSFTATDGASLPTGESDARQEQVEVS
jgi:hypothetical protein